MTIDTNSYTLADLAMQSNPSPTSAIAFSLVMAGNLAQDITMVPKKSLTVNGLRVEGNLPTIHWKKLNEEGVAVKGKLNKYTEQVYIVRDFIDVDRLMLEDENSIQDPRTVQLSLYSKALTYDFNNKYINNNHVDGDSDAFLGIRARIDNGEVRSENKIDAGGVVVTQAATSTNANVFFEYLDQLLWSVGSPDGTGVVLYMNDTMQRRLAFLNRIAAGSGGFRTDQDQFGRGVSMYKNAVIRDVGTTADQSTKIIANTETSAGADGASTYTSIYAVRHSTTDGLFGWEMQALKPKYMGLLDNGIIDRTFLEWAFGLIVPSTRALARLYDLKIS